MNLQNNKIGLVLEGGGFRGMYTSGVLDALLEHDMQFSYVSGVSAGAAYGISYLTGQHGRNLEVNRRFINDSRYLSWRNFFRKGNVFDWDFVYGTVPNELVPLHFDKIPKSETEFYVGITNCHTGKTEFKEINLLPKSKIMATIAASSSLPLVSKIQHLGDVPYLDGGIDQSIPIAHAFWNGCQRLVVVLTQNKGYTKKPLVNTWLLRRIYHKYPKMVAALEKRAEKYNATLKRIEELEAEGKIFVIRPKISMKIGRLERNVSKHDQLYGAGRSETLAKMGELKKWISLPK